MRISLPFPDKCLWPNGGDRTHPAKIARLKKSHKKAAFWSAKEQRDKMSMQDGLVPVRLIVHAKPKGPLPDRDNCIAAMKAYQDGISAAIGIDDKHFAEPKVVFAEPRDGRFVLEVGANAFEVTNG